jgi:hypothetical protein
MASKIVLVALLLAMVGCGGADTGRVSGTVLKQDGSPLVAARVIARSADSGKSAYGTTDSEGRFELGEENGEGIPAGDYDVVVLEDRGDPDSRRPPTIAAKYREPAKSGLRIRVAPGESQQLNLTLDPP